MVSVGEGLVRRYGSGSGVRLPYGDLFVLGPAQALYGCHRMHLQRPYQVHRYKHVRGRDIDSSGVSGHGHSEPRAAWSGDAGWTFTELGSGARTGIAWDGKSWEMPSPHLSFGSRKS